MTEDQINVELAFALKTCFERRILQLSELRSAAEDGNTNVVIPDFSGEEFANEVMKEFKTRIEGQDAFILAPDRFDVICSQIVELCVAATKPDCNPPVLVTDFDGLIAEMTSVVVAKPDKKDLH